jgi:predicted nucleic acid-binding protein
MITLDTSFVLLHYFSKDPEVLKKSREVFQYCRIAGNSGILPCVVLAESYAIIRRDAGREVAEHRFKELVDSGLKVVSLSQDMARESGIIRAKYHEKIPWGDCLIAGTHVLERADVVLSEDPHFKDIREIKAKTLAELKI